MPPAATAGLKGKAKAEDPVVGSKRGRDGDGQPPTELDLVFCLDCTVSMGPYIAAAQQNICGIVEALVAFEKCDVRFGLVAYRDHPPQAKTFVTKKFDFTSSTSTMRRTVNALKPEEGGDLPESMCCGLHETLHMDWRKESTKVAILVADAPPHGLGGDSGDGFPNGCPDGHDPLVTARKMAEGGICLYTVGCEPGISRGSRFAVDFIVGIADITGGQAVTLSSSRQLVDIILGGTQEEIALERLMSSFERERREVKAEWDNAKLATGESSTAQYEYDDDSDEDQEEEEDIVAEVHRRMAKKGIETKQLSHNGRIEAPHAAKFSSVAGLAEWRSMVARMPRTRRRYPVESFSIPASEVTVHTSSITPSQVKRMHDKDSSRSLRSC